jgi:hypothetical protein
MGITPQPDFLPSQWLSSAHHLRLDRVLCTAAICMFLLVWPCILCWSGARLVATDQPQAFLGPAASTSANAGVNAELKNVTRQELITPELDTWISDLLKEWNSPGGLSVAVVKQHDDDE